MRKWAWNNTDERREENLFAATVPLCYNAKQANVADIRFYATR
jgi:hypothetical protein